LTRFPLIAALLAVLGVAGMVAPRPVLACSLCGTVRDAQTSTAIASAGIFLRTPAGAYQPVGNSGQTLFAP
jgi:hypothetical protein